MDTGARGIVNSRDKGALAVYAQVKAELAEQTASRRTARTALAEAAMLARDAGVSAESASALLERVYGDEGADIRERQSRVRAEREADRKATAELKATGMTCPECDSRVIVAGGRVVCANYGGCELSVG